MNIYEFIEDVNNYNSLKFFRQGYEIKEILDKGIPLKNSWKPFEPEEYNVGKDGDFPGLYGSVPVFSQRAWDMLGKYLINDVEALPIINERRSLYAINVLKTIDCLDKENSELSINSVANLVSDIYTYKFNAFDSNSVFIFKIPEVRDLKVYVTDNFIELMNEFELVGAKPKLVGTV